MNKILFMTLDSIYCIFKYIIHISSFKKIHFPENEDSNYVVNFVGDMFNSYKHLKNNKEKFILFISITVAIGLSIFLAIFIWNLYRSKRLDRIAKSLRQPNLSQSTLCSSASNGNGGRRSSENNITGKY